MIIGGPKIHIRTIILVIVSGLLWAPCAWPWGRIGHRVAATMAEDRLTPAALAGVRDLRGPGVGLAEISIWADEQREIPRRVEMEVITLAIPAKRHGAPA
jgi:hypothetical protein